MAIEIIKSEFSYDVPAQKEPQVYLHDTSFIPGRLAGRGVTKAISEEEFNRYLEMSEGKVITDENINDITGNDILISLPYPAMPTFKMTTYKKVVDLKCSMGQGVLVWADGESVSRSPVVDFDYQDEVFDEDLAAVTNFMLFNNK